MTFVELVHAFHDRMDHENRYFPSQRRDLLKRKRTEAVPEERVSDDEVLFANDEDNSDE